MTNLRSIILTTILALVALGATFSVANAIVGDVPISIGGRHVYVESNNALQDIALVLFWTSDDAATVDIDTGTEACAEIGMDCHDTWIVTVGATTASNFTDSTCATDQTDAIISFSFCN